LISRSAKWNYYTIEKIFGRDQFAGAMLARGFEPALSRGYDSRLSYRGPSSLGNGKGKRRCKVEKVARLQMFCRNYLQGEGDGAIYGAVGLPVQLGAGVEGDGTTFNKCCSLTFCSD
jgi:hypothetical protein